MLQCFVCGDDVTEEENEGDDDNGLCADCADIVEEANRELDDD